MTPDQEKQLRDVAGWYPDSMSNIALREIELLRARIKALESVKPSVRVYSSRSGNAHWVYGRSKFPHITSGELHGEFWAGGDCNGAISESEFLSLDSRLLPPNEAESFLKSHIPPGPRRDPKWSANLIVWEKPAIRVYADVYGRYLVYGRVKPPYGNWTYGEYWYITKCSGGTMPEEVCLRNGYKLLSPTEAAVFLATHTAPAVPES